MEHTNYLDDKKIVELMKTGFPFEVNVKIAKKSFWKFWKKPEITEITKTYKMEELTLSIIVRIFSVKKTIRNYYNCFSPVNHKKFCKIIALAAIGKDLEYFEKNIFGEPKLKIKKDELNKLSNLFYKSLSPTEIYSLIKLVEIVHNYGDIDKSFKRLKGQYSPPINLQFLRTILDLN